jgi:lipopolysaccharide export system protein LptA
MYGGLNTLAAALGCLMLLTSSVVWTSDADQPIEIAADSAVREEPSGRTTYKGDVILTQGSLEINADTLTFSLDDEGATLITANGKPATLSQQPENRDTPVEASANIIEYHESKDRVRLIGNAKVLQDGAVIEGSTIEYLVTSQRVMAAGSPDEQTPQRVKVVIPPSSLRDDENND